MAKQKTVGAKRKKLWFKLLGPAIFRNKELGEITAYEPKQLVGRHVELAYSSITGSPKDSAKKFVVKIVDVKNEKAETEPLKILFSEGYVQRACKRYPGRYLSVEKQKTKDGKEVTSKLYLLLRKHIAAPIRSQLLKRTKEVLADFVSKIEFDKLFEPNYIESLSKEIKKELKPIYPADRITFWKVLVS